MADNFLNKTGLAYYHNRIKALFATKEEVPTKTSDLTNDGDGTSNFATESYVDENGGKIDVIKVNDTAQTITNKTVNIEVPESSADLTDGATIAHTDDIPTKVSDLTNDSGFQDESEVQALIDDALADITGIDYQIVATLPATGEKGVIYLVGSTAPYDEYIWLEPMGGTAYFDKIGSTDIDLSDYWAKTELTAITTAEIDTIVA